VEFRSSTKRKATRSTNSLLFGKQQRAGIGHPAHAHTSLCSVFQTDGERLRGRQKQPQRGRCTLRDNAARSRHELMPSARGTAVQTNGPVGVCIGKLADDCGSWNSEVVRREKQGINTLVIRHAYRRRHTTAAHERSQRNDCVVGRKSSKSVTKRDAYRFQTSSPVSDGAVS
jgi:hypothetical protein